MDTNNKMAWHDDNYFLSPENKLYDLLSCPTICIMSEQDGGTSQVL